MKREIRKDSKEMVSGVKEVEEARMVEIRKVMQRYNGGIMTVIMMRGMAMRKAIMKVQLEGRTKD